MGKIARLFQLVCVNLWGEIGSVGTGGYRVLYTTNDAGLVFYLFLDRMYKLNLAYLPMAFLYNLSQS